MREAIANTLYMGVLVGLAILWLGLALGSSSLSYVGVLTVVLTPPAALVLAAVHLAREGYVLYSVIALIEVAVIASSLIVGLLSP